MNLLEILKANGIAEETIESITTAMKENKVYTSGEENVDIRFGKLKDQHNGTVQQLNEANKLIEELKKSNTDSDSLKTKIQEYENSITDLEKKLLETRVNSAVKVALMSEKAVDIDYLTFKLNQKLSDDGKTIELDDNDNVKDWNDIVSGLKTQFPTQFETSGNSKKIIENKLGTGEPEGKPEPKTLAEALRYADEQKNENI